MDNTSSPKDLTEEEISRPHNTIVGRLLHFISIFFCMSGQLSIRYYIVWLVKNGNEARCIPARPVFNRLSRRGRRPKGMRRHGSVKVDDPDGFVIIIAPTWKLSITELRRRRLSTACVRKIKKGTTTIGFWWDSNFVFHKTDACCRVEGDDLSAEILGRQLLDKRPRPSLVDVCQS